MSNTIYLDINAKNSKIHTSENNIMTYELPDAIPLPTGTEVKCLQSIVNQQGVVGTSITLEEDIEESIIIQYYVSDTQIQYPTPSLNIANPSEDDTFTNWQVLQPANFFFNPEPQFGTPTETAANQPWGTIPYGQTSVGGTEIAMPMVMLCEMDENGTSFVNQSSQYLVPMTCEIPIFIEKGTYNVNKLAETITDQINGLDLVDNDNLPFRSLQMENGSYNGYVVNGTTLKSVVVVQNDGFVNFNENGFRPGEFQPYKGLTGNFIQPPQPLKPEDMDRRGLSAIAVHPKFAQDIRRNAIQGNVGQNVPTNYIAEEVMIKTGQHPNFFQGFNSPYAIPSISGNQFDEGCLSYYTFNNGMAVGSTDFRLSVNEDGEFQIDNTHTPRYIPTYDYFGNKQENAGQEACYIKRVAGTANSDRGAEFPAGRTGVQDPIGRGWYKTLSQPMRRTTGFMVLNWAYKTCNRISGGNAPPIDGQNDNLRGLLPDAIVEGMDKNRTYDEWYNSKQEAREAWEQTIWYRLGFTYDDIQNPDYFETQYYPDKASREDISSFQLEAFTTNERLDVSALTTASTLVNGQAHSSTGTNTNKNTISGFPSAISGIQTFNTIDVNVPFDIYNNNAKYKTTFGSTTGAYKGSFYYGATMVPVITQGIPVSASRLPILSNDGYMLVISDLVEPNDVVKNGSFLGLLDILPKSNLQNTDYIQDRNVLTHTISNPQVIKAITLKIVNPDLTNIELEPNSAFLLSLTFPQPKQTIMLASLENNAQEQAVAQSIQQNTAEEIKRGELPLLPTFQQYNTIGAPAPETHTEAQDTRTASRRRIDIAKHAVALNKLSTAEEKNEYLARLPEKDRTEVAETAERMKAIREGRRPPATGGGGGGGAAPRSVDEYARDLNKIRNVEDAKKYLASVPTNLRVEVNRKASADAGYMGGAVPALERITALNQLEREERERTQRAERGRRGQPSTPAGTTEAEREELRRRETRGIARPTAPARVPRQTRPKPRAPPQQPPTP